MRFFVDGAARYVTVDNELPNGGTIFNSGPAMWASLIEVAYAEVPGQRNASTGNSINDGNSFSTIGNGGVPEDTLLENHRRVRDHRLRRFDVESFQETFNNSLGNTGSQSGVGDSAALAAIAASLAVGDDVILSSYTNATNSKGLTTLVADHAMSVYGYDFATGRLEIRNPWGTESGQNWETTFEVGIATLLGAGDTISIDDAGTATTVAGASALAASGLQTMAQVVSFTVSDDVTNVTAQLSNLIADGKMTALRVHGSAAANSLNLTGLSTKATINLDGDFRLRQPRQPEPDHHWPGRRAHHGLGAETDDYLLGGAGGVETIAHFMPALDHVDFTLNGGALMQTMVSGGDWLTSTTDLPRTASCWRA